MDGPLLAAGNTSNTRPAAGGIIWKPGQVLRRGNSNANSIVRNAFARQVLIAAGHTTGHTRGQRDRFILASR